MSKPYWERAIDKYADYAFGKLLGTLIPTKRKPKPATRTGFAPSALDIKITVIRDGKVVPTEQWEREAEEADRWMKGFHEAADVRGTHYTSWREEVKRLRREDEIAEAEELLLECLDAIERHGEYAALHVSYWFYSELAVLYRKEDRRRDEVRLLRRFRDANHDPDLVGTQKLLDRLAKIDTPEE